MTFQELDAKEGSMNIDWQSEAKSWWDFKILPKSSTMLITKNWLIPLVREKSITNWLVLFYINFYLQCLRYHLSFKVSLILRYLLSNYEQSVRPVENSSLPLTVEFSVSLHQVNKLYFWVNFCNDAKVPYCYLQCFSASGQ